MFFIRRLLCTAQNDVVTVCIYPDLLGPWGLGFLFKQQGRSSLRLCFKKEKPFFTCLSLTYASTFEQIPGDNWTSLNKVQLLLVSKKSTITCPGSKRTANRTQALNFLAKHARESLLLYYCLEITISSSFVVSFFLEGEFEVHNIWLELCLTRPKCQSSLFLNKLYSKIFVILWLIFGSSRNFIVWSLEPISNCPFL